MAESLCMSRHFVEINKCSLFRNALMLPTALHCQVTHGPSLWTAHVVQHTACGLLAVHRASVRVWRGGGSGFLGFSQKVNEGLLHLLLLLLCSTEHMWRTPEDGTQRQLISQSADTVKGERVKVYHYCTFPGQRLVTIAPQTTTQGSTAK